MKINIHILFDELKQYNPRKISDDNITLNLRGIRLLTLVEEDLSSDYIYLVKSEGLGDFKNFQRELTIVCLGDVDEKFIETKGWQAIIINNNINEQKILSRIQDIFDSYSSWSEELTEAILNQDSIQNILDIGTRYYVNPIALFDISFKFICKGGPLHLSKIGGTIWETVLDKGYSPIETLSNDYKNDYYKNLEESDTYFAISPPENYSDAIWAISSIYKDHKLYGFLASSDLNGEYTLGQYSLINYLKNNLELYYTYTKEYANANDNTTYFVDRILNGFSIERGIVEYHLKKNGWLMKGNFKLLYLCGGSENIKFHEMLNFIVFRLDIIFNKTFIFPYEKGIIVILRQKGIKVDYESFCNDFNQFIIDMDLVVGVSMPFTNFLSLKYAFIQSKAALKNGLSCHPNQRLFKFEDYYSKHVVQSLDEATGLKCLCHPKLLEISSTGQANERNLIHTLKLLLLNGCNISKTAEILDIHRNTLMYRIEKIEDFLDINLKEVNAEQFLNLYLTCLILDR